jgi:hypothetical protein
MYDVAAVPYEATAPGGAIAIPLHRIAFAKAEGGGLGLGLFSSFKIGVEVVPLYGGQVLPQILPID